MPMHVSWLSKYPDFFAAGTTLLITGILAIGVKESSRMNNIFTGLNLLVVTFIVIAGGTQINFKNWSLTEADVHASLFILSRNCQKFKKHKNLFFENEISII